MGTGVGRVHPIAHAANDADLLSLNLYDLGNEEVDRRQPFASLPVVSIFALQRKGPRPRCRIGEDGLQECFVDIGAVGVASERPVVPTENADSP